MDNKKRLLTANGIDPVEFESFHRQIREKSKRAFTLDESIKLFQSFNDRKESARLRQISQDREKLPVFAFKAAILETVAANQVVLIAADTGAGKSTQVPQYLLESGLYDGIAVS
jgi:HrpA-like RNA helicase